MLPILFQFMFKQKQVNRFNLVIWVSTRNINSAYVRRLLFIFLYLSINSTQMISQIDPGLCFCNSNFDLNYFKISHYHKIEGHSRFSAKTKIQDLCATTEFPATIKVASDGSESSIIEIDGFTNSCFNINDLNLIIFDDQFNMIGNSMPETYGEFTLLNQNGDTYIFKFRHPTLVPPAGMPYGTMWVAIGNSDYTQTWGTILVNYYRPPVTMVHGLWSNEGAFNDMKDHLIATGEYLDFQIYKADYSGTNDKSFSTNFLVVPTALAQSISNMRLEDISAGKSDLVCHSMGGILTRLYLKNPLFADNKDVRRVVTCNTPHAGSQMANFLLDTNQYGTYVASVLNQAGMNCNGGAVSDLRVGTTLINGVAYASIQGDVDIHAIRTNANVTALIYSTTPQYFTIPYLIIGMIGNNCSSLFLEDVFDSPYHDAIVAAESQDGGLTGLHVSVYTNQVHMGSVANGNVKNRVHELLNYPENSPYFTSAYNGLSLSYSLDFPCLPFTGNNKTASRMVSDVEITSPASGTNINTGANLTVNYTASMVDTVLALINFQTDSVVVVANAGNAGTLQIPVPSGTYGVKPLVLIGLDAGKSIVDIDSVMVNFTTTASLDSISVYPRLFFMNQLDTLTFTVFGHYSDGLKRNITKDAGLNFNFTENNVSRFNQSYLIMNGQADDTLYVSKGLVTTDTILIKYTGTNYPANCQIVTNTNNDGPGSLRLALECTASQDTIFFSPALEGDTIYITGSSFNVEKSIKMVNLNAGKVTIRTAAYTAINIFAGTDIRIENIDLISDHPSHNCINNFGQLTMKNVICTTTSTANSMITNELNGNIIIEGNTTLR